MAKSDTKPMFGKVSPLIRGAAHWRIYFELSLGVLVMC